MKKRVLIAASTGFIGKNLYEYLETKQDIELYTLNSKDFDFTEEEKVRQFFEKNWFDVILMCANYGDGRNKNNDVNKVLEYNMRVVLNFEKCCRLFGKLLYFGSGAEFDKRYDISMVTEQDFGKSIPIDQYGMYKYIANKIIETSDNMYNLRLFGVYGKYEDWKKKFISNACCKAVKGIPITIRKNLYFDYLWINDLCRIVEHFIYYECKFHTYNVVTGIPISLVEIAEIVKGISGKNIPIYICEEGLGNEYTANNCRLLDEIKDFKYTSIEESIRELYKWYIENENMIELFPLLYQ